MADSTNGGATYTVVNNIVSPPASIDKPWIATGPDAGTPGNEAVLITYRSAVTILATAASVSGLGTMGAFTAAVTVSDVGSVSDAVPAIGDDGEMVVTFTDNTGGQGLTNIFLDRDLNGLAGGLTFGVDTKVTTSNAGGFDFIPATPDRSTFSSPYVAYDRSGGVSMAVFT